MEDRYRALIDIADEHGPCSVRHIFYRAVVEALPGITKDETGYQKVQRAVLQLRRRGDIDYCLITDNTRWMVKPTTWTGPDDVLNHVARTYRRDLWNTSMYAIEVWVESDSIAGTIHDVVDMWAVPMFVCRGQASESFVYQAVEDWGSDEDRRRVVLYIGDHDPAGLEIEAALTEKIERFNVDINSDFVEWEFTRVGVTWDQVEAGDRPGTSPKKQYGYPLAVEAEALPPTELRSILDSQIEAHVDHQQLRVIRSAEKSERDIFLRLAQRGVA